MVRNAHPKESQDPPLTRSAVASARVLLLHQHSLTAALFVNTISRIRVAEIKCTGVAVLAVLQVVHAATKFRVTVIARSADVAVVAVDLWVLAALAI